MDKLYIDNDKNMSFDYKMSEEIFSIINDDKELLKIKRNGDIYVKGKLIENEKEVVDAFREYFNIGM